MSADSFFDTNVALYAVIEDQDRFATAQRALANGGIVSVQVLNEMTNTLRRKFRLGWDDVATHVGMIAGLMDDVVPVTLDAHARARDIAERHNLQFYDSLLLASALEAGCRRFVSEDMQDGLCIDSLTVENPFRR
jgi:predicted nucleic acid-binding protein